MFKFSFPKPDGDDQESNAGESVSSNTNNLHWLSCEKVTVSPSHLKHMLTRQSSASQLKLQGVFLAHLSTKSAVQSAFETSDGDSSIKLAEQLHSDLIPAKYEGGLKIWECTDDLLGWLIAAGPNVCLSNKNVLDLGCGTGLLGIAALKAGASVVFQDYNKEVLDACTIPNVLLNLTDEESQSLIDSQGKSSCEFYSGDWSSFVDKLQEGRTEMLKFDYILTSETIYNSENYSKLINVFKKCLKNSGTVYLAAKTYYFGVGGGTRQFETALQHDSSFKSEVCWKCSSGVSREILKISLTS
ncbi:histidine protein methyltransferase 1 homolog [Thrips palmi]|uniref:protein-histidine N-methyltransferase n=1 Tax=Thrips palmi TaxID=161013 RepID=A0A6P8YRL5_THRPL|nr:histidine protein methyltransferase 1 homolog [Thrips palmi]